MVKKQVKKPESHCMDIELGEDWLNDCEKVVEKVGTRVKTSALRYGFYEDKE